MKNKIINIFVIILSCLCLQISFATQQDNSIKHFHNGIRGYDYFYILDSYKYNKENNTFSIDIVYDYDYNQEYYPPVKSPYDKNDISFIILGTTYSPSTKKFSTEYKGFISSYEYIGPCDKEHDECKLRKDVRIYYNKKDKKLFSQFNDYIFDLKGCLSGSNDNGLFYYKKDVQYLFYGAYQRGELFNMRGIFTDLEIAYEE